MPRTSKAAGSVALVTGANRGIGLAFVQELAARGARKVYAGVRSPGDVIDEFTGLPVEIIVGSVDTQMAAHVQGRKEDPRDIARAGLAALDRGEYVADTDFMAVDARARYARDPVRYECGMTKLLKATVMKTGR
jgi:NAD(P)-dependent dehydrogenase (short-subunit alcohol dehydrogenase family)